MSHELRREYLNAIRERYNKSARSKKSLILTNFAQSVDTLESTPSRS